MPNLVARVILSGASPPTVTSAFSVFSTPSTGLLLDRGSVMDRSIPFIAPANAGSLRKPTTSWYGPTVRRSWPSATFEPSAKLDTTTASAAVNARTRDIKTLLGRSG
jgi:hypothetical protein